jgi:Tfp pilus assembly protein PilF
MTDSQSALRARQFYQQGVQFAQRGQLAEAVDALRLAIRTMPEHLDARIRLGAVLLQRGKADEGLQVLDAGLARPNLSSGERGRMLTQASACAVATNRYELARAYLERALELGGRPEPAVLNQVAAVCCKGGEFGVGFEYFLKASERLRDRG